MNRLYEALSALNHSGAESLLVMGDLVNGTSAFSATRLLREVEALCDRFQGTVRYMPGNHDLDYLSKAEFYHALACDGASSRFRFEQGGYSFICLDANFSPDGSEYACGNFEWPACWVPDEEIDWLRTQLTASELPAIVVSHQRIDCDGMHSVLNHAAVSEVIARADKVAAVFQGHRHKDDLKLLGETSCYTLAAHVDGAGPAVAVLDTKGVRLIRDFQADIEASS
jgi:hypothetical protein